MKLQLLLQADLNINFTSHKVVIEIRKIIIIKLRDYVEVTECGQILSL